MILETIQKYLSSGQSFAGLFNGEKPQRSFNSDLSALFGFQGNAAMHQAMRRRGPVNALRNPTVYRCIKGTVDVLSTLPIHTAERDTKKPLRTQQSEMLAFPNDEQTAPEFWSMMYANLLTHGNAFAEKVYVRGRVEMLLPMCAAKVTIERRKGEKVYLYSDLPGSYFAAHEIMHLRLFGPDDLAGLSPIAVAESIICLDALQEDMLTGNAGDGGRPDLIIQLPPEKALERINSLTPAAMKADRNTIQSQIEGARSRLALYLPAGYEGTPLSANFRDQQVSETRDANVAALARVWGFPLSKLGVLSKADNASTVGQADLAWYKDVLRPQIVQVEERLRLELMTPAERARLQLKINADAVLRGDTTARTQYYRNQWQIGAMTTNEIREFEDMPRFEDPQADKPHWPVNMTTEQIADGTQPDNPAAGGVPPARLLPIFEDVMGRIARKELAEIGKAARSLGANSMEVNFQDRIRELYSGELLTFIERQLQPLARVSGASSEACKAWARSYAQANEVAHLGLYEQPVAPAEAALMARVPAHAADLLAALSPQ